MWYIENKSREAAFHFSVEEYIMKHYPFDEPVMMIWQTDRCAMIGNYQIAEAEIDMRYAKDEGVQIVRRSSGGGTIFTDEGTFLYTIIQPYEDGTQLQQVVQKTLAAPIVSALNKMGVPAKAEGRNDILVDGKKVSGLAQYARHGRICSHGSLLYDADLEALVRVLRVDEEKIRSKAISSIRSRVTNVKEHMPQPYSTQEFLQMLKQKLFETGEIKEYVLREHEIEEIEEICEARYRNPDWTFGRAPKFSFHNSKRFSGGKVEVYFDVAEGIITDTSIRGDFLGTTPIQGLEELFTGKEFRDEALSAALESCDLSPYLGGITKEELLSCIFE